jgi:archaellum biogenesis ATPase FlaH
MKMHKRNVVFRTGKYLKERPDPEWLVDGVIEANSMVMLSGAPGQGKSFLALDMALHIASGKTWCGRTTLTGSVVYIATEGVSGMKLRLQAWEEEHNVKDVTDAVYVLEPIQLRSEEVLGDLMTEMTKLHQPVRLIIFDTFNRCFDGDENSSKDVGEAMPRPRQLAKDSGATLMIVHHTSKAGGYRGSSVLAGDMDTMMKLAKKDADVLLQCDKQKNAEAFDRMAFRFKSVELPSDKDGRSRKSAVLVPSDFREERGLSPRQLLEVQVLSRLGPSTTKAWHQAVNEAHDANVTAKTFERDRKVLLESGLIVSPTKGHHLCSDIGATLASSGQLPQSDVTDTPLLAEGVSAGVVLH